MAYLVAPDARDLPDNSDKSRPCNVLHLFCAFHQVQGIFCLGIRTSVEEWSIRCPTSHVNTILKWWFCCRPFCALKIYTARGNKSIFSRFYKNKKFLWNMTRSSHGKHVSQSLSLFNDFHFNLSHPCHDHFPDRFSFISSDSVHLPGHLKILALPQYRFCCIDN